MRIAVLAVLVLLCQGLASCKQVLYGQLGEHEANEMLAALALAGLEARKRAADKHWAIEVEDAEIPQAMQVLAREGLPRQRYTGLAELFKRETIVATPTEERVRFIHGLSQEIARTLSMIDGVLAARVHIVLPHNDPLADRMKPSSASVFIRHRPDADLQRELTAIRSLVVRSIEGLGHDHVYVSLFAAERGVDEKRAIPPVAVLGISVSRATYESLRSAVLGMLAATFVAGFAGAGWWAWRRFTLARARTAA